MMSRHSVNRLGYHRFEGLLSEDLHSLLDHESQHVQAPPPYTDMDLVDEASLYLCMLLEHYAQLARRLCSDSCAERYIDDAMSESEDTDHSDFSHFDHVNGRIIVLNNMAKALLESAVRMRSLYSSDDSDQEESISSSISRLDRAHPESSEQSSPSTPTEAGRAAPADDLPASRAPISSHSVPDDTVASYENDIGAWMEKLATRGTGRYTCPHGQLCAKGGFVGGALVVFEQNCKFKEHLRKHERPFKCGRFGCKNTKGFARLDQLIRHQERCGAL